MHHAISAHSPWHSKSLRKHILLKYSRHSYLKTVDRGLSVRRVIERRLSRLLLRIQDIQPTSEASDENSEEEEIAIFRLSLDSG